MKPSYRIAIAVTAIVCIAVIIYFRPGRNKTASTAQTPPTAGENLALQDPSGGAGLEPGAPSSAVPGAGSSARPMAGNVPTLDLGSAPAASQRPAAPAASRIAPPTPGQTAAATGNVGGSSPAASASGSYVIQKGDTMEKIAVKVYGDGHKWRLIAQANPRVDPRKLRIGQVIRVPDSSGENGAFATSDAAAAAGPRAPASRSSMFDSSVTDGQSSGAAGNSYTVKSGDTLSSIARQFYSDPTRWNAIYQANRAVIRNPNQVKPGTQLRIPAL